MEQYCREKVVASRSAFWSLLAVSALAACATPGEKHPAVNIAPVPDATKPEAVSFFGILRNGRMSPEAWKDFGKVLSTPFSQGTHLETSPPMIAPRRGALTSRFASATAPIRPSHTMGVRHSARAIR